MCQGGTCVPDPALDRVRCQGSGAACGYCQDGVCTASEQSSCDDGTCPQKGQCCSDERWCSAPDSPLGFYCVDKSVCCPETEGTCADGSCIKREFCCKEQKRCGPSLCVGENECCPAPDPAPCGECEKLVSEGGEWICQASNICGPPCYWGYCPKGYECNGYGVCCDWESGHCTCSSGSTGGVGCNGKCCPNGCSGTGCNPW